MNYHCISVRSSCSVDMECGFSCFENVYSISCVQILWCLVEVVLTLQLVVQVRLSLPLLSSQNFCEPNYVPKLYPFVSHTDMHYKSHYHIHCLQILVSKTDSLRKSDQVQFLPITLL